MIESGLKYKRKPEELRDILLSWNREDKAFFAAGACHILAHMFLSLHTGEGFELIYIKPRDDLPGNHFFASDGINAFDFNGWSSEEELIRIHKESYLNEYPDWDYDRIVIKEGLVEYLKHSDHLRPPEYYPELPWTRAYNYIKQFPFYP